MGAGAAGGGAFGYYPDTSQLTPQQRQMIQDTMSKYTYSVPAGGWITNEAARNANSAEIKYNMQSPGANEAMRNVYDILGSLPTVYGNPMLNAMNAQRAAFDPNYNPASVQHFRSYNEVLGKPWEGPWGILPQRPTANLSAWTGGI